MASSSSSSDKTYKNETRTNDSQTIDRKQKRKQIGVTIMTKLIKVRKYVVQVQNEVVQTRLPIMRSIMSYWFLMLESITKFLCHVMDKKDLIPLEIEHDRELVFLCRS